MPMRIVLFPILTVELGYLHFFHGPGVQAAHIHADAVRMGSGEVKRLDTAVSAERVLGGSSVERVCGQAIIAAQELEPIARYDQSQVSGF